MKRRIIACILIVVLLFCAAPTAHAHDDQGKHDKDLKYVLFGEEFVSRENGSLIDHNKLRGDELTAFKAIANAAALTIDQFSANTIEKKKYKTFEDLQEELAKLKLPRLVISFDSIDLNANVSGGVNIHANSHRCYTHQGWNYSKYPNPDFWNKRKEILINVVNEVLFYPKNPLGRVPWLSNIIFAPSEQCEAFCGMVYYIHILGDHIEGDVPEKLTDLEPLIQYANLSTPGIITELQEQLNVLFVSQRSTRMFMELQQELSALKSKAEKNCGTWGAVDTKEKCEENQMYAAALLDILAEHIPQLLSMEPFFTNRFSNKAK